MFSRKFLSLLLVLFLLPVSFSSCVRFENKPGITYPRPPYAYPEKYFNYRGAKVCYVEAGNPKGETVIFIHGITGDSNVWRLTMKALEKDYHVIAIDLPGYGKSDKGDDLPLSISYYAEMVFEFIKMKNLNKVTLVGNSIGGHVVLYIALDFPGVLKRAVIVGSTGVDRDMNWYEHLGYIFLWNDFAIQRILPPASFRETWEKQFVCTREYDKEYDAWPIFHDPKEFSLWVTSFNHAISSLLATSLRDEVHEINIPLLIMWGGFDYHHGVRDAYYIHEQVKGSKMAIDPTCGHLLMLDDPEFFNQALLNFLKTGDPQTRSVSLDEIRHLAKEKNLPLMKRFKDHPLSEAAQRRREHGAAENEDFTS